VWGYRTPQPGYLLGLYAGRCGGAIGSGIGAGIASTAKMYEVTALPYLKYNRPEASCINMQNGMLSF
jgi:hypothetical protein